MRELPPYIKTSVVARAIGVKGKAARSMLERAGILESIGRLKVVGESRLRERLPEVYNRVCEYLLFDTLSESGASQNR